jgi:hypothetical protein
MTEHGQGYEDSGRPMMVMPKCGRWPPTNLGSGCCQATAPGPRYR